VPALPWCAQWLLPLGGAAPSTQPAPTRRHPFPRIHSRGVRAQGTDHALTFHLDSSPILVRKARMGRP
jgi:hypothetical protein